MGRSGSRRDGGARGPGTGARRGAHNVAAPLQQALEAVQEGTRLRQAAEEVGGEDDVKLPEGLRQRAGVALGRENASWDRCPRSASGAGMGVRGRVEHQQCGRTCWKETLPRGMAGSTRAVSVLKMSPSTWAV